MPLTPHYKWSETGATLEVTVDVPGVSRAKADVFATDAFLKVNCPPYLFALDLHKDVDDSRSSATIITGAVIFKLFKRDPGLWGCLAASGDKAELARRRNDSIDRAYREVEEARKARLARKQQEDKDATQRSMAVDRRKRQEMDRRKAEELAEERGRLEEWRKGLQAEGGADAESDYEDEEADEEEEEEGGGAKADGAATRGIDPDVPAPDHPDYHGRGWRPSKGPSSSTAAEAVQPPTGGRTSRRSDSSSDGDGREEEAEEEEEEGDRSAAAVSSRPAVAVTFKPLPPPRTRLEPVQVNFTKLETGHLPAREQREEEIRAFRKQVRAAASSADDPDSVDLAERQPLFLKDKGDAMFKAGNYSGALNAYSRAIQLDDCHAAVRSNRAACRLALGDPGGCVEDCDRALDLLAERRDRLDHELLEAAAAAALRRQLVRLLVRRAQARVAMAGRGGGGGAGGGGHALASSTLSGAAGELLAAAVRDYEEAMGLSPSDPSLESDYQELLAALQPADATALRQRGDARFRSGDHEGAAEAFSALLGLPRSRVPESERLAAFSNRAACNLVLERYGAAVADCDAGLALLLPHPSQGAAGGGGGFGAAAGEAGLARLSAWAQSLRLPVDDGSAAPAASANGAANGTAALAEAGAAAAASGGCCGLAPAAAAAAAARLLTRRGAAAAHLQHFAAAAGDHQLAAALLRRLGEAARAEAAEADAVRMQALAEGREQLPPRPPPQQPQNHPRGPPGTPPPPPLPPLSPPAQSEGEAWQASEERNQDAGPPGTAEDQSEAAVAAVATTSGGATASPLEAQPEAVAQGAELATEVAEGAAAAAPRARGGGGAEAAGVNGNAGGGASAGGEGCGVTATRAGAVGETVVGREVPNGGTACASGASGAGGDVGVGNEPPGGVSLLDDVDD